MKKIIFMVGSSYRYHMSIFSTIGKIIIRSKGPDADPQPRLGVNVSDPYSMAFRIRIQAH